MDADTSIDFTPWELELENTSFDGSLYNVATVRMPRTGRLRDFDAGDVVYNKGDKVSVDGERIPGVVARSCQRMMCRGRLPRLRRWVDDAPPPEPAGKRRETEVFRIARHVAATLDLPIKIVRAEAEPSGKIVVHYATEERTDCRELFRRVSAAAQGRVELRQVGVRDAAKALGGVGSCGLQLCCTSFLREFAPVSIKMAKEQGLVLNPHRVSGLCGRLLCCLTYEDELYRTQRKLLPKLGKRVITLQGPGKVRDVDVLAQTVRVMLETGEVVTIPPGDITPMFPSQKSGEGIPTQPRGESREPKAPELGGSVQEGGDDAREGDEPRGDAPPRRRRGRRR